MKPIKPALGRLPPRGPRGNETPGVRARPVQCYAGVRALPSQVLEDGRAAVFLREGTMPRRSPAATAAIAVFFVGFAIAVTGVVLIAGENRRWAGWLILAGFAVVLLSSWVSTRKPRGPGSEEDPKRRA